MIDDILYVVGSKVKCIGELIPVGKTTLLHGRSGSGKTMSIIKYLNENEVTPYFIDFDSNDEYASMDIVHIDGYKLVDYTSDDTKKALIDSLTDGVVIIDTYALASKIFDVELFIDELNGYGITVIIIAHTVYYSGKPAEPACEVVFSNHVACRLHLHNEVKKTKTDVYLEVEKLRGKIGRAHV